MCINKHRTVTKSISEMNEVMNGITFSIYMLSTPAINLFLYLGIRKDIETSVRIVFTSLAIFFLSIVFMLFFVCSIVSKTAHKSRPILHPFLIKVANLSLKERLLLQNFNEWLSGRDIGFYCLDLFPMNNYQFYQYCCGFVYSFFLIVQVIHI